MDIKELNFAQRKRGQHAFCTTATDPSHSLRMTLAIRCHSERRQKCRIRKQESGNVTRSEESITLMTSYRLPHYGSRSFTFASDDALPSGVILNGARILCEKAGKRSCDTE